MSRRDKHPQQRMPGYALAVRYLLASGYTVIKSWGGDEGPLLLFRDSVDCVEGLFDVITAWGGARLEAHPAPTERETNEPYVAWKQRMQLL